MISFLDIAAFIAQVTLIIAMLGSILALVDMCFDGYVRIGRAAFLLFVAGMCVYTLNVMTGY